MPEQLGDKDTDSVLLELRLAGTSQRQVQGPDSVRQVPLVLPFPLKRSPQQTKMQQEQETWSSAPEAHVPIQGCPSSSQDWLWDLDLDLDLDLDWQWDTENIDKKIQEKDLKIE